MKKLYEKYLQVTEIDRRKSWVHEVRSLMLTLLVALPVSALLIYLVNPSKLQIIDFTWVMVATFIVYLLSTMWVKKS